HHLVNVLLHALNTVLLCVALHLLTQKLWRSAFIAGVFAVHPLHIQSVAWISELKDVLSAFFGIATLIAYAVYTRSRNTRGWYLLVCLLFGFSLLSKATFVTLP